MSWERSAYDFVLPCAYDFVLPCARDPSLHSTQTISTHYLLYFLSIFYYCYKNDWVFDWYLFIHIHVSIIIALIIIIIIIVLLLIIVFDLSFSNILREKNILLFLFLITYPYFFTISLHPFLDQIPKLESHQRPLWLQPIKIFDKKFLWECECWSQLEKVESFCTK